MILDVQLQAVAPGFVREHRFHAPRKWRFDYAWPELMVALELEGGVYRHGRHTRGQGYERDCEKYNQAALDGWTLIRVTPGMVKSGYAADTVEKALEVARRNARGVESGAAE